MFDDHHTILSEKMDLKSDRLNDEVALFMGCTLNETLGVVLFSLSLSLIIALPSMGLVFRSFTLGLAAALVIFAPMFFIFLSKLSRLKRDKPAGYYRQYLNIKLANMGFIKQSFVMHNGLWSVERRYT